MQKDVEEKITYILDKIDTYANESKVAHCNQESEYLLNKKLSVISLQNNMNVSAFDLEDSEQKSDEENIKEKEDNEDNEDNFPYLSSFILTEKDTVKFGKKEMPIDVFLDKIIKEVDAIPSPQKHPKENKSIYDSPSKRVNDSLVIGDLIDEKRKRKLVNLKFILQTYLQDKKSSTSSCSSLMYSNLSVSEIDFNQRNIKTSKSVQITPIIFSSFVKDTIKGELEKGKKRFSVINPRFKSNLNSNTGKVPKLSLNSSCFKRTQALRTKEDLERSGVPSFNEYIVREESLWSPKIEPIVEHMFKDEKDDYSLISELKHGLN